MVSGRRAVAFASLLSLAGLAVGCSFEHSSSTAPSTKQSTPSAAPTPNASTGFIGTWSSTQTTAPQITGCGNFQWAISTQTASNIGGTFSFTCAGNITVTASATGVMTGATTADLTVTGTGNVSGQNCDFSVSGVATAASDMTSLTYPYTGTTCFGPVHGTETLNKKSSTPPPPPPDPTPTPTPDPTPPPPPPPGFDLPQSILLNSPRDMASWPITTRISNIDINAGGIAVDFDKKDGGGRWPDVPFGDGGSLQYTLGMCLDISGQWYCSSVIEFWYGLERSGGPPSQYALNWFYDPIRWAPMTYHQPAVGETIGLFVCEGDCRNQPNGLSSPLRERSNVVLVAMPSDAGASYPQRLAIRHR